MKIKVAIYDADKGYRERFADYLMSYKAHDMELSVFTQIAYLLEGLHVDNYQLLVLGCGYEEVLQKVREIQIPVLVLTEYTQCYVREAVGTAEEQITYLPKYQSMDIITRQMQVMTQKKGLAQRISVCSDLDVVGVLSPCRHEMQMFFSLLYAKDMARHEKVLYINLLELSGFEELFGETEYNLEDVILQLREKCLQIEDVVKCIYEMDGVSYISPVKSMESVKEIAVADITQLLKFVVDYTDYSVVVFDVGTTMIGLAEMLMMCTRIYCLTRQGYYFDLQKKQLWEYLEKKMDEAFLERIKILELPYQAKVILDKEGILEQLDWSEFGAFVREKGEFT